MINVICAIAKNENPYINDWVNWHLNLGFNKIYLYDNNDPLTEFVGDFIEQKDKVEIIDIRGKKEQALQIKCYNEFYNSHTFDWCAFLDIDEFLVLNKWSTIQEFVSDPIFEKAQAIRLNWHVFGDDGLIERDMSIPVYRAFKNKLNHEYNSHGKEIIRGGIENIWIESTHWAEVDGKLLSQIMPDGLPTTGKVGGLRDCKEAWVNHYMTKSLSEFVKQKLGRGDAVFVNREIDMGYYWTLNKSTPDKLEWLKKFV